MKKRTLGVIGGKGMVGSDLGEFLAENYKIFPITRENYAFHKGMAFDILIDANGNSKRFWALNNVLEDFMLSTVSVYNFVLDFKYKKYIYISSSDVYANPNDQKLTRETVIIDPMKLNSYGFHKFLSEQIVRKNCDDFLILRLSMILGKKLKKGPFYDILNSKELFITLNSKLQLITTEEVANIIKFLVEASFKRKIFNVGGIGSFDFKKVENFFKGEIKVSKKARKQHYEMNELALNEIFPLKKSEEYLKQWLEKY